VVRSRGPARRFGVHDPLDQPVEDLHGAGQRPQLLVVEPRHLLLQESSVLGAQPLVGVFPHRRQAHQDGPSVPRVGDPLDPPAFHETVDQQCDRRLGHVLVGGELGDPPGLGPKAAHDADLGARNAYRGARQKQLGELARPLRKGLSDLVELLAPSFGV
jgi:hypothetical protein